MPRIFALMLLLLLISTTLVAAQQPGAFKLAAPAGWGGETIQLPPGFARDMKFKGLEHIRFAPGMMKADSDSFFCYAFVFELEPQPELTAAVVKAEFLKYYRGLSIAVLGGKLPDLDPASFTLELKQVKPTAAKNGTPDDKPAVTRYTGVLKWVEPFATQKPQQLNLEIQTWTGDETKKNYLFACVSPQPRDAAIWKQLHGIRDDYQKQ